MESRTYSEEDMKKIITAVSVVWERIKEVAKEISKIINVWIRHKKARKERQQIWQEQRMIRMNSQTRGMPNNGGFVYHNRV